MATQTKPPSSSPAKGSPANKRISSTRGGKARKKSTQAISGQRTAGVFTLASSARINPPAVSRMRSPRGRGQQLDLLGREQRTELHGKALDEILVGVHRRPVRATVGVVVELPEMDELIDHARVGLEVADQLLVLAALLERRVAEFGVQLDGLGHLADVKRVGPHLIHRHD